MTDPPQPDQPPLQPLMPAVPTESVPPTRAPFQEVPVPEAAPVSLSSMEAEMKARMDAHAKLLEKAMTDEFLQKKRVAEEQLEEEMEMKRQKRLRDLEEEIKEETLAKQAKLASLDLQLQERMQLVADEQTLLDDLKDKSIEMQRKLEEESKTLSKKSPEPMRSDAADPKTAMKAKLKEKLDNMGKGLPATPTSHTTESLGHTPVAEGLTPTTSPKEGNVIMPMTDMRFTSSTHPAAWQFLYRMTKKEEHCDKSIYDAWHAGAPIVL